MSSRKQREKLREKRIAFDRAVEASRKAQEEAPKPKKRGRPKKTEK